MSPMSRTGAQGAAHVSTVRRRMGMSRSRSSGPPHGGPHGRTDRNVSAMRGSILGTAVRRVEDPDLITGNSTYVGNLAVNGRVEGLLPIAFVRSPLAQRHLTG